MLAFELTCIWLRCKGRTADLQTSEEPTHKCYVGTCPLKKVGIFLVRMGCASPPLAQLALIFLDACSG